MADKDDRDTSLSGRDNAGGSRGAPSGGVSGGGSRGAPSSGAGSAPSSSAGGGGSRGAPSSGGGSAPSSSAGGGPSRGAPSSGAGNSPSSSAGGGGSRSTSSRAADMAQSHRASENKSMRDLSGYTPPGSLPATGRDRFGPSSNIGPDAAYGSIGGYDDYSRAAVERSIAEDSRFSTGPASVASQRAVGGLYTAANFSASSRNTPARSSTGGIGSDYAASSRSIGGGLYSAAGVTPSFRASEIASMASLNQMRAADLGTYRTTDLAEKARAQENKSMRDLALQKAFGTILSGEIPAGDYPYDRLVDGKPGFDVEKYAPVTSMTVREAVAFASTLKSKGHLANVLGGFQFKDETLELVATRLGLMDETMTPAVQERLAVGLFQERATKATVNGQIDIDRFAQELSKEWASLATSNGNSYYVNNGVDKAHVDYASVRSMAKDLVDYGVVSPQVSNGTPADAPKPTSRSNFGATYLGDERKSVPSNGLPARSDVVPTARPGSLPSIGPTPTGRPQSPAEISYAAMEMERAKAFSSRPAPGLGLTPQAAGTPTAGYDVPASTFSPQSIDEARREQAPRSFADKYLAATPATGRDRFGPKSSLGPDAAYGSIGGYDDYSRAAVERSIAEDSRFSTGPASVASQRAVGGLYTGRPDGGVVAGSPPATGRDRFGPKSSLGPDAAYGRTKDDAFSPGVSMQPNGLGRTKDDRFSPAQMSPNAADRTKDDRVSAAAMSPNGLNRTKDDKVSRSADMAPNSTDRTKDDAVGPTGAPVSTPGTTNVSSLERALQSRNELERFKDMDLGPADPLSQVDDTELTSTEPAYVDDENVDIADLPASTQRSRSPASTQRSRSPAPASEPAVEKDSIPEIIAGTGFDVLAGMIPGVGLAVTAINIGLGLFGQKTIGQRLADAIFDGDNQYQPGSRTTRNESGGRSAVADSKSRFAAKYLQPAGVDEPVEPPSQVQTSGRPTPKQRWVDVRDTYGATA